MSKIISIVIPVYNVEKYLPQCLSSIVEQTYKNLEIIIINDGSKDNCPYIIENFSDKDERIKVITQKNAGISAARNAGLKVASGDYLMFVDSDDWLETNACSVMIEAAAKYDADVVMASYIREFKKSSLPRFNFKKEEFYNEVDFPGLYRRIVGPVGIELSNPATLDSLSPVWGKLYKSKLIKKQVQFTNTAIIGTNEDLLFNLQVLKNAKSAVGLSDIVYHYRKFNAISYTTNYKSTLADQWNQLHFHTWDLIKDNPDLHQAFNNRIALTIIGLGLNELQNPKDIKTKIKNLRQILSTPKYTNANKQLTLKFFPIHWKLFFWFVKKQITIGVFFMLLLINFAIKRNN